MLLDEKVPVLLFTLINFSKTTEIMYIKEWIQKDFSTVEAYMSHLLDLCGWKWAFPITKQVQHHWP